MTFRDNVKLASQGPRFDELAKHSLRLQDVTPIKNRANAFSKRLKVEPDFKKPLEIVDGSLGDPTKFGFSPSASLTRMLVKAIESDPFYTHSIGFPDLIEELRHRDHRIQGNGANEQVATSRLGEKEAFVIIGPGSSGVVRSYFGVVAGGKTHKAVIFVPELTYPLFLAESAYVEADVVTVPLDRKTGLVDPEKLKSIMENALKFYGCNIRYVLVGTTIGNPLGSAMDADTFNAITRVLNELNSQFGIRLHRITDPTYERFRRDQTKGFDPVEQIMQHGSTSVELVTGTFSKSECWPGKRLGYGIVLCDSPGAAAALKDKWVKFREKTFRNIDESQAITLGTVDIHTQMAAALWLHELRTNPAALREELRRQAQMRDTVNRNTLHFAHELSEMEGVKIHPFCLTESGEADPDRLNSFYIMWRFVYDRNGPSQAARFAEWTLAKALEGIKTSGVQGAPAVFMNDGDMFFASNFRARVPQYIRTVALLGPQAAERTINLIREFGSIVHATGSPPPYVEALYPF